MEKIPLKLDFDPKYLKYIQLTSFCPHIFFSVLGVILLFVSTFNLIGVLIIIFSTKMLLDFAYFHIRLKKYEKITSNSDIYTFQELKEETGFSLTHIEQDISICTKYGYVFNFIEIKQFCLQNAEYFEDKDRLNIITSMQTRNEYNKRVK